MKQRVEFDGTIGAGGVIHVPDSVRNEPWWMSGRKVRVRLIPRTLDGRLRSLGIDDEEIDRIAAVQAAPPEQVVRCLLSEGSCAAPSSRRGGR